MTAQNKVQKFTIYEDKFNDIHENSNNEIIESWSKYKEEIEVCNDYDFLTVAFIGQYSAGKSTIISALTGIKDIHISADIATGETTHYDWNGVKIIDTPGLFTERKDHDEITEAAIKKADLLVFCLTHSLFDSITAENFKKLAFDNNYKNKMMLVVNKFSSEAGSDQQKVDSYTESLGTAIEPHRLDQFRISYVDALDYLEGNDDDDSELIDESRFVEFTTNVDQFIEEKKIFSKLDTPIRILESGINDAIELSLRDSNTDNTALEILNQFNKTIVKTRTYLDSEVSVLIQSLKSNIRKSGSKLSSILGESENLDALSKEIQIEIETLTKNTNVEIHKVIEEVTTELFEEIQSIFEGSLFNNYSKSKDFNLNLDTNISDINFDTDAKNRAEKFGSFKKIAEQTTKIVGDNILKGGVDGALTGILKSSHVNGSVIHKGIYDIGSFFGKTFKPWEAVNLAKNLGNVMKFAGPLISIITLVLDVNKIAEDDKNCKKLTDARKEINKQFDDIGNDIEKSLEGELDKVKKNIFDNIKFEIDNERQEEEAVISSNSVLIAQLSSLRNDVTKLLTT